MGCGVSDYLRIVLPVRTGLWSRGWQLRCSVLTPHEPAIFDKNPQATPNLRVQRGEGTSGFFCRRSKVEGRNKVTQAHPPMGPRAYPVA